MPLSTPPRDQHTFLFIGDSITDCRRRDQSRPLGDGYVQFFRDFWLLRNPGSRLNIINKGISGDTVQDLRNRWHEDVLTKRPDWLSVKVGVNDLNRHLADSTLTKLSPASYEETYDQLLTATRETLGEIEILLISPFLITTDAIPGSNRKKSLELLQHYLAAVRRLSERHRTRFLDLHAVFQEQLRFHHPDTFCPEPVHPNNTGHLLIAEEVYRIVTSE
jgi:lysophospholipase L1-like esterase